MYHKRIAKKNIGPGFPNEIVVNDTENTPKLSIAERFN